MMIKHRVNGIILADIGDENKNTEIQNECGTLYKKSLIADKKRSNR